MRVLGIDASLRSTGLAVVESRGAALSVVTHRVVRVRADRPMSECLVAILHGVRDAMDAGRPDVVAIESAFYFKNARTAMALGQARGVAIACCAERGLPVYEYAPRRAKQSVVGFGGADKEQVQRMTMRMFGLREPLPPDASDAAAIAVCHLHSTTGYAALQPKSI
jgi:crossover junction endodeoxyribonuclease RuvC